MEHKNVELFFDFLREVLREPQHLDFADVREEWLSDLERYVAANDGSHFEVEAVLTKSGRPVCYDFRREIFLNPDDNDWDQRIVHGESERMKAEGGGDNEHS